MNKRPIAVIAGDIHFTLASLEEATKVVEEGLKLSKELDIPFILNGDTLDSKAIIRAEVANRLIDLFRYVNPGQVIVNTGNHDMLNHAGKEHSLNFLRRYVTIVDSPTQFRDYTIIPDTHEPEDLRKTLSKIKDGSMLIMHQGVAGANMGHYLKDTASLPKAEYARFRVIASHYHMKQDIDCGPGIFSYIGSPYTTSFAEANDGPKGISIIYSDGSLELVPLNIRRHVIIDLTNPVTPPVNDKDLYWVKAAGTHEELKNVTKKKIADTLIGHMDFKFDKIYTDSSRPTAKTEKLSNADLFDKIIDGSTAAPEEKPIMKKLWKDVLSESNLS